jgi:hypothetical protein
VHRAKRKTINILRHALSALQVIILIYESACHKN